jgi:hypothetical protein
MERKRRKRGGEKKGRGERERKKEREREKVVGWTCCLPPMGLSPCFTCVNVPLMFHLLQFFEKPFPTPPSVRFGAPPIAHRNSCSTSFFSIFPLN